MIEYLIAAHFYSDNYPFTENIMDSRSLFIRLDFWELYMKVQLITVGEFKLYPENIYLTGWGGYKSLTLQNTRIVVYNPG